MYSSSKFLSSKEDRAPISMLSHAVPLQKERGTVFLKNKDVRRNNTFPTVSIYSSLGFGIRTFGLPRPGR